MESQEPGLWQRNRVRIKATSVGILILVLLMPTGFIHELFPGLLCGFIFTLIQLEDGAIDKSKTCGKLEL